jgi:mercuric ion binding protein
MKHKVISILAIFFFLGISGFSFSQEKKETFTVFGNGALSKARIERTALSLKGVKNAFWDEETKIITVTFNESKTDVQKIQVEIAKTGFDTGNVEASDEAYNNLPVDCQYRKK